MFWAAFTATLGVMAAWAFVVLLFFLVAFLMEIDRG